MNNGEDGRDGDRHPPRRNSYASLFQASSEQIATIIRRRNQGAELNDEVAEGLFFVDDQANRNNDDVMVVDEPNEPVEAVLPPAEVERAEPLVVVAETNAAEREQGQGDQGESSASFNYDFDEDRFLEHLRSQNRQETSSQATRKVPTADASVQASEKPAQSARAQRFGRTAEQEVQCVAESQEASTQVTVPSTNVSVETIAIASRDVGVQSSIDVMEQEVQIDVEHDSVGVQIQVDTAECATQYDPPVPTSIAELYSCCFRNKGFMEGFHQGVTSADAYIQSWRTCMQANPLSLLTPDVAARSLPTYQTPPDCPPNVIASLLNQEAHSSTHPLLRYMMPIQQFAETQNALVNRNLFPGLDYSNPNSQRMFGFQRPPATPFMFNPNVHQNSSAFYNQHSPEQNFNLFAAPSGTSPLLHPNFTAQIPQVSIAPTFPNNFPSYAAPQMMMTPEQGRVDSPVAPPDVVFTYQNQSRVDDRMAPAEEIAMPPNEISPCDNAVTANQDALNESFSSSGSVSIVRLPPPSQVHAESAPQARFCTTPAQQQESQEVPVSRQNSSEDRPATPEVYTASGRPVRTCQAVRMAASSVNRPTVTRRRTASTDSTNSTVSRPKNRKKESKSSASKKRKSSKKPVAPKPNQSQRREESETESNASREEEHKMTLRERSGKDRKAKSGGK